MASSQGMADSLAARKLGLATVPVIELFHLSERDKRALILADNKLAERAGWDKDLLALEAGDLRDMGVELGDLGFTAGDIDDSWLTVLPIPARTTSLLFPRSRSPAPETSGNSDAIGSCAATPPMPMLLPGSWTASLLTSWSPTRPMG